MVSVMRLKDKIALITGAGSGIGSSTAKLFAEEGATVLVNDVDETNGMKTVEAINRAGGQAHFYHADVSDPSSVKSMIDRIIEKFGRIDILFNNAGISCVGALHEIEPDEWEKIVAVNVKSVYLVSKYTLPYMMERKNGCIINMSSCVAEMGLAGRAVYAASKGAILSMTKSMQVDYAPYNIRVNALLAGAIYTPLVENFIKKSYPDPELALQAIKQRQISGELGRPEDVARAALFLASDESRFIMGSPLYVDGGVVFCKNA